MKINIQKAKNSILSLGEAFFQDDRISLAQKFQLSADQIDEGFDSLKRYTKNGNINDLSSPSVDCEISIEEDDEDEENEEAPLRIYSLDSGGWGYEMDVLLKNQPSDITMRGELSADFNTSDFGIKFHLFEVM